MTNVEQDKPKVTAQYPDLQKGDTFSVKSEDGTKIFKVELIQREVEGQVQNIEVVATTLPLALQENEEGQKPLGE